MGGEIKSIDEAATPLQYAVASNTHSTCEISNEGIESDSDVASTTDDISDEEQPMIHRVTTHGAYHEEFEKEDGSAPEAEVPPWNMDAVSFLPTLVPVTYQFLPSQNGPVAFMQCPSIDASTFAQPPFVSQHGAYLQQAAVPQQPGPHYGDAYLQQAAVPQPGPNDGDLSSEYRVEDNSRRRRGGRQYQADTHSCVPEKVQQDIQGDDKIKREAAIAKVSALAVRLAFDREGCRLLQWTLENTDLATAAQLAAQLHGHVHDLLNSPHGNYVIQKVITVLPNDHASFVAEELCGGGKEVARHRYGCRVICRLIEHAAVDENQDSESPLAVLLHEVLQDLYNLSRHAYGHYVIECLFEHGTKAQQSQVVETLCRTLGGNIMNRNSGFVIEKIMMLEPYRAERRRLLQAVKEAIDSGDSGMQAALEKSGRIGYRISLALQQEPL